MARVFSAASTQSIYDIAWSLVTDVPFTVAMWAKPTNFTTYRIAFNIGTQAVSLNKFRLYYDITTGVINAQTYGSGSAAAVSSVGATAGVWSHACGVFASSTDRRAFLNGGNKGTNATSQTVSGADSLFIGRGDWAAPATNYYPFEGSILWPAIWDAALTDSEVASLGFGANPLTIRPDSLRFFAPLGGLDGDIDQDVVSGTILTTGNSPTWSDDSPSEIYYPSAPYNQFSGGGGGGGGGGSSVNQTSISLGLGLGI